MASAGLGAAFDAVRFLAGSAIRWAVLDQVRSGPRTRDELLASTPASRVTVDRALGDLEDRGWIDRPDDRYQATPAGEVVATEFGQLVGVVETAPDTSSDDPELDAVGFLARAPSRLELLAAITESPRTRRELRERTDVSRATLSRLLGELEARDWVHRTNGRYAPTPRGRTVTEACTRHLSNLEAVDALADVLGWLPVDAFEFDLACLRDAELIAADWDDPTASIHHVAELVRGADRARIAGPGVTREVSEAIRALTIERGGTFEGITDADAFEVAKEDETIREALAAVLDSGRATLYEHPGELPPYVCSVIDDAVVLCGHEDRGPALQAVVSDDPTVRSWAESWFTARRAEAEPVDEASFTA